MVPLEVCGSCLQSSGRSRTEAHYSPTAASTYANRSSKQETQTQLEYWRNANGVVRSFPSTDPIPECPSTFSGYRWASAQDICYCPSTSGIVTNSKDYHQASSIPDFCSFQQTDQASKTGQARKGCTCMGPLWINFWRKEDDRGFP